ncbi:Hsp20/alpha crystallin family protein [Pullulanibacillus sp. KACC 23026]|uniref:Hsp20/alpha crystallin family protein n=1 Tax=Pullulanibacillus sp. KACC 23026 TaxID=3028315 RepID=UPI0023AFC455|nr:Hsp20/alpha crystallin family protein [Pullulanibacillus sp. KACC 23026]WEG14346.1 Hsp20/alpha crystallin family protein [Pullulanibacillus sp. KACC 23026]
MDVDKLKKWLDMAQQFQGENFWSDLFGPSNQPPMTMPQAQPDSPSNAQNNQQSNQESHSGTQGTAPVEASRENTPPVKSKPEIDIFETETEWIIWVDLPGVNKTDIQLNLIGRKLIIKGVAKLPFPKEALVHSERLNGSFERSITMPENLSGQAKPVAKLLEGILEIRLAREQPRKLPIQID